MEDKENSLLKNKHILMCLDEQNYTTNKEFDFKTKFCGIL